MRTTVRRLIHALNQIDVVYLADVESSTLTDAEYSFMYALDDGQPHTQTEICRTWLLPKTTVNTIAKRWEREGLLGFENLPGKGNNRRIVLTERGRDHIARCMEPLYRAEEAAMAVTLSGYDTSFIEALEEYGKNLKAALSTQEGGGK